MDYREKYTVWLEDEYFDEETKKELKDIEGDEREIEDRFFMDLEFGTAGLRGIIGAGTNRMNVYTVRRATQGLANYILSCGTQEKGVAIAFDSRRMSLEFAEEAALCLAANGIRAYRFDTLRPTPELSYAVRKLGCTAGINITASHNPPEYNGYKVYWDDGAQITPPHDVGIIREVEKITNLSEVLTMPKEDAVSIGLYRIIGKEIDDAYIAELKGLVLSGESIDKWGGKLKIVYTPLHGTGNIPVRRVLSELGFKNVYVVPEQELPDGEFPTVSYPNPEAEEAFELALALGKKIDADLVLATDPDADRLGVYVKDERSGTLLPLTGNMSGCLIGEYEIARRREKFGLPADGVFIKSIVSTNLADAIAEEHGVKLCEVLTGFKFIGQKMKQFEEEGGGKYLFGMEESYGCLPGTYCRDKDAVAASMVLCEAAAYYKERGWTLWDAMEDLYKRHGFYVDGVRSITLKGIEGIKKIGGIMETFRRESPKSIGEFSVCRVRDYKSGSTKDLRSGEEIPTGLPVSNVIYYELPDNMWVCMRPSGTEPKLKYYYGARGESAEEAKERAKKISKEVAKLLDPMLQ